MLSKIHCAAAFGHCRLSDGVLIVENSNLIVVTVLIRPVVHTLNAF